MPAGAGAVVVVVLRAQPCEGAVALGAELQLEMRTGRTARQAENLLAREQQPQRIPRSLREQHQQRLQQRDLAAEAASHGHGHDAHAVRRHLEELGDLVADLKRSLRRSPDCEAAVWLGPDDRHVRLHRRVVNAGDRVGSLDHDVGPCERSRHVAALHRRDPANVARFVNRLRLGIAARAVHRGVLFGHLLRDVQHHRGGVAHGRLGVGHRVERLEVDLERGGAVVGRSLRRCNDGGDRLAGVEDTAERQRLLGSGHLEPGQVRSGDHVDHALDQAGGGGVDRADAGAGERAEIKVDMEEAGQLQVGRIAGRS